MEKPNNSDLDSSDERNGPLEILIVTLVLAFVWWKCAGYLFDAHLQYRAAKFPSVQGKMTRYYWNEFGMVGESELQVEYNYAVNGQRYFGTRKRYAWRHFGSGSDEAIKLARSWGKGNVVKVFYDPHDPSNSALDNLFTPGDWKTLACAVSILLMITTAGGSIGWVAWQRMQRDRGIAKRKLERLQAGNSSPSHKFGPET
jgi:hypothetical protein